MYPSPYIRFKSVRQEKEWFGGDAESAGASALHPALYVLALAAAHWHYRFTGSPAVVTQILRSPAEQLEIYPDSPARRSPHEFGRAIDLRTRELEPEAARQWEQWLNAAFAYRGRSGVQTALFHEVGGRGGHLHLQVGPAESLPRLPETFIAAD